jgi:Glyoxalase/Bleomycin resistance protein/Dioxygenase superfamily
MLTRNHASDDDLPAAETSAILSRHAAGRPTLDHLAIGVRKWSDAYPRFVRELGGRWGYGGPAGDFAPYQLVFGRGMKLEFISPHHPDGFMQRFMERRGPSPHHVTFKVFSIEAAVDELSRLGFEPFAGRPDIPAWREAFVHPKQSGLGTLLQIVQSDEEVLSGHEGTGRPADFPAAVAEPREVAWFGLTVADLGRARDLLVGPLHGTVPEEGDGWFFVTWGHGRSILVRSPGAEPASARLWAGVPDEGVGFVLFGPGDLTASSLGALAGGLVRMPHQRAIGVLVWLV